MALWVEGEEVLPRLQQSGGSIIIASDGSITYDVPTGEIHDFRVNAATIFTISGSGVSFEQNIALGDDDELRFGAGVDYWFSYDLTNTRFRLRATDIDGAGADGDVFRVEDGTDDVDFLGGITLGSPLVVGSGGTGLATFTAAGRIPYSTSASALTTLAIGAANAVLTSDGSVPAWTAGLTDSHIAAGAEIAVTKLADGAARQLLQTDAAGTGVEGASDIDIPGPLDVTGAAVFDATARVTGLFTAKNVTDAASVQVAIMEGDRATPANSDEAYLSLRLSNSAGTQTEFARIGWEAPVVTAGSEDARYVVSTLVGGAFRTRMQITPSGINLFLPNGSTKAWENGANFSWFTISSSTGAPHFRWLSTTGAQKAGVDMQLGNLYIGTPSIGTDGELVAAFANGVAPTTSPANEFQMYSADIVADNAAPHFRTENNAVIKLYQETTAVAEAAFVENIGGTAVNVDSTFGGYTLQQMAQALQNQGMLA